MSDGNRDDVPTGSGCLCGSPDSCVCNQMSDEKDTPKKEDTAQEERIAKAWWAAQANEQETGRAAPGVHGEEKVVFLPIPDLPGVSETQVDRCPPHGGSIGL